MNKCINCAGKADPYWSIVQSAAKFFQVLGCIVVIVLLLYIQIKNSLDISQKSLNNPRNFLSKKLKNH